MVALVGIFGCDSGGGGSSETFESPSEMSSSGGQLRMELTISEQQNKVGDLRFTSTVYNGDYAAPLLRVRPGDTVNLRLRNLTRHEPSNVHYHGLEVSPKTPGDSIFVQVEPENCYDYTIKIPSDQSTGLYWYHSHMMGLAETQVFNGLSGGLLVEGIADKLPFLEGIRNRVMVLKDIQASADGKVTTPDYSKPTVRTINGVVRPSMSIRPGETQLWRVGNMGANLLYKLSIDGHEMVEISRDGNIHTRPVRHTATILPPGARTEFLITGGAPGTYTFRTLAVNTGPDGDPTPEDVLGTLHVSGTQHTPLKVPETLADVPDLRKHALTRNRRIVFSENNDLGQFFINGRMYSPSRDDVVVPLGSVEKWDLVNSSAEVHTFHIHQTDFQVVSRNGRGVEFTGYQDSVDINPGESVQIIIPFTRPSQVGRFVFHCHILEHEDGGMMQNIVVVDPSNPAAVDDNRMVQGKPCS
jgi:FtsP/CotA-like multicopper oxidase with cupredoxin domain